MVSGTLGLKIAHKLPPWGAGLAERLADESPFSRSAVAEGGLKYIWKYELDSYSFVGIIRDVKKTKLNSIAAMSFGPTDLL